MLPGPGPGPGSHKSIARIGRVLDWIDALGFNDPEVKSTPQQQQQTKGKTNPPAQAANGPIIVTLVADQKIETGRKRIQNRQKDPDNQYFTQHGLTASN
jgi:hypothetical protein